MLTRIPRPTKVIAPIAHTPTVADLERAERDVTDVLGVSLVWALGSDAVVLLGAEGDVLTAIEWLTDAGVLLSVTPAEA